MSQTQEMVLVKILEKEYQVACPADEKRALIESARVLDEKMRDIKSTSSVVGVERIAVMAALNMAHDFLRESEKATVADKYLQRLSSKINDALNAQSKLI